MGLFYDMMTRRQIKSSKCSGCGKWGCIIEQKPQHPLCQNCFLELVELIGSEQEMWLYKNKKAFESVLQGLEDAKYGKLFDLGSFTQYIKEIEKESTVPWPKIKKLRSLT